MEVVAAAGSGHPALDHWNGYINTIATHYAVEPNLVKAHIEYESDGDPDIVGSSGRGLGLMQIDYGTYRVGGTWWYKGPAGKTDQIFDPYTNILIGVRDFMVPARDAFPDNLDARIAAYNAGIERVRTHLADVTQATFRPWYVPTIKAAYLWFSQQKAALA